MLLPTITNKQKEILLLLYRFRFLNRIQIQTLLKHKNPKNTNVWLKDLTIKNYIGRIFEKTPGINKPAIYFISKNGIKFLKSSAGLESEYIKKLYQETRRSAQFIDQCIAIANIYLSDPILDPVAQQNGIQKGDAEEMYHEVQIGFTVQHAQAWKLEKLNVGNHLFSLENDNYIDKNKLYGWGHQGNILFTKESVHPKVTFESWLLREHGIDTSKSDYEKVTIDSVAGYRLQHTKTFQGVTPNSGVSIIVYLHKGNDALRITGGTRRNPDVFVREFDHIMKTIKFDK